MTQPKRLRFQIHLSTAVALMFATGTLIWANTSWWPAENHFGGHYVTNDTGGYDAVVHGYGWPSDALDKLAYIRVNEADRVVHVELNEHRWRGAGVLFDAGIALAVLIAVWFVCEKLIRKR